MEQQPHNERIVIDRDGSCTYHPGILSNTQSAMFLDRLTQEIEWTRDEVSMFGKRILMNRKVAWYGDQPFEYRYSGITKTAQPWSSTLAELKLLVDSITGERFNSCLLNYYHDGSDGMGWHADNEKTLEKDAPIASISLGAERPFDLRHRRDKQRVRIHLEDGSMLLMKDELQRHWLHQLPKTKKVNAPRINATFRYYREEVLK